MKVGLGGTRLTDLVLLSLDQIMSHSGAQGSIGSHSAIGLRNNKVLLLITSLNLYPK